MVNLLALPVLLAVSLQEGAPAPSTQVVNVRNSSFYKKPSRLGGVLRPAKYQEHVTLTGVKGRFSEVKLSDGKTAYILSTALIAREKFKPQASDEKEAMEMAAQKGEATRGIDPQTEKKYRSNADPKVRAAYLEVDRLVGRPSYKFNRSELERRLLQFRRDGKLGEFRAVR